MILCFDWSIQLFHSSAQVLEECGVIPGHRPQLLAHASPCFLQLVLARSGQLVYLSTQGLAVVRGASVGPET